MSKKIDTTNLSVGQAADIILGDGTLAKGGVTLDVIAKDSLNDGYAEELAFMEENIEIVVQEAADENAENPVIVGVNGVFKPFFRGQPTIAKRKFVDALIVKSSRVTTPKIKNGAGEDAFAIRQTSAHKFPFMVISDPSPRGLEWLRRRMAEVI
jgi:hypothetical protein